ncbi:MAG: ABC transporter substrate-binding protein [Alphaproteobacteria bacterium]|nr:MAG: ABC transporter substrate-binding protein [Alphaproteobacteria bacterium]
MSAALVLMLAMSAAGTAGTGHDDSPASAASASASIPPMPARRIASLDYCADAHLLALADRAEIAALSSEADAPYAWAGRHAPDLPRLIDGIEGLIGLNPGLVVTTAGHARAADLAERAGLRVVRLGYLARIEDSFAALRRLGSAMGRSARAESVIQETKRRMASLQDRAAALPAKAKPRVLYLTPSGVTTGAGTYVDRLLRLAGLRNLLAERGITGWSRLRLEDVAALHPDLVITSFFAARHGWQESWRLTGHPLARRLLRSARRIPVPAASWGCAGFFAVEAAERIVAELGPRIASGDVGKEGPS